MYSSNNSVRAWLEFRFFPVTKRIHGNLISSTNSVLGICDSPRDLLVWLISTPNAGQYSSMPKRFLSVKQNMPPMCKIILLQGGPSLNKNNCNRDTLSKDFSIFIYFLLHWEATSKSRNWKLWRPIISRKNYRLHCKWQTLKIAPQRSLQKEWTAFVEKVGPAPLQIKRGALGPIRNRKAVEKIIQNRKTEKKFDQNRNRMQNC